MVDLARLLRDLLVPALVVLAAGILATLAFVVAQRAVLTVRRWRVFRVRARYVPALRTATASDDVAAGEALSVLRAAPRRHRRIVAEALLEPLRVVQGSTVDRARSIAAELGLLDDWRRGLTHGSWPARARAALAVGLCGTPARSPP